MLTLLLYGISGFTALAYEVLWMRLVSTLSGASNFGMVVTLSAFMAGLGLGSAMGARLRLSPRAALMGFAACEIFAALMSLAFPSFAALLERGFEAMAGSMGISGWMGFHIVASLFLLLIPATALGMSFPFVLRALKDQGIGVGRIYGLNTLGGVLGALAPLVLLPTLGWGLALRLIAAVGLVVGLAALMLSLRWHEAETEAPSAPVRPPWPELVAYAGIGAAALMLEVGWTRIYGMIFMRTEYVLGVILAVVLLGIALGSLLARRVGSGVLNLLPLVAGLAALLPLALLPPVSSWMESARFSSLAASLATQGAAMFALTFLATLALGAWLPLIVRHKAEQGAAAWLYGANSLGAALGAGVAGWLLLPWLGSSAVVGIAALLLAASGAYWCSVGRARAMPLLLIPAVAFFWHAPAVSAMLPAAYGNTHDLSRYEDAVTTTQVVARANGVRLLLDDLQRVDASTDPTAVAVQQNQGRLPLLLHPDARSVLFLGLGTGITASVAHHIAGLKAVAVELSPGAIKASGRWFGRFNGDAPNWLDIRHDDARRFLMADHSRRFDAIVGDLFHPDLAGRGLLLSLQQFQRVRACLSANGVYAQWLALNQFDLKSLKVVLATFRRVFPHNILVLDGFHLAMVGFRGPLPAASAIQAWAARYPQALTGGEGWQTWLGRDLGPIPALQVPVQDEWSPVVEFRLAKVRVEGDFDVGRLLGWLMRHRAPPRSVLARWHVDKMEAQGVMSASLATDAMMHVWQGMFSGRTGNVSRFMRLAYEANARDRWVGFAVADAMSRRLEQQHPDDAAAAKGWAAILKIRPDDVTALRALWHLARKHDRAGQAAALLARLEALVPLDPEVLAAQHDRDHSHRRSH